MSPSSRDPFRAVVASYMNRIRHNIEAGIGLTGVIALGSLACASAESEPQPLDDTGWPYGYVPEQPVFPEAHS